MPSLDPFDRIVQGIKDCKAIAIDMYNLSSQLHDLEIKYADALSAVRLADLPELDRLSSRLQDISGHRRCMELGSFIIETNRTMETAYQKLP